MMKPKIKPALIAWSGGIDSTSILMWNLDRKLDIDCVYIKLKNNQYKSNRELGAIKKIIKHCVMKYPKQKLNFKEIEASLILDPTESNTMYLPQPAVWCFELSKISDPAKYDHVELGYISPDSFWHIRREFESAFENLSKIIWNGSVSIHYPWADASKSNTIEYLRNNHPKILKKTTWCERAEDTSKRCGVCRPCITYDNAVREINILKKKKRRS